MIVYVIVNIEQIFSLRKSSELFSQLNVSIAEMLIAFPYVTFLYPFPLVFRCFEEIYYRDKIGKNRLKQIKVFQRYSV